MALISEMMTYSSFYITASPIMPLLGILSNSIGGEEAGSWEILYLYYEEPIRQLRLVELPIGRGNAWVKRHLG